MAERQQLVDLYLAGTKISDLCRLTGRSAPALYSALTRAGVKLRNASKGTSRVSCEVCGDPVRYVPPSLREQGGIGRFCSRACMGKAKRLPPSSETTELLCTLCRAVKPVSEFHPHSKNARGWQYWCKTCIAAKRRERASQPQDPRTTRKYKLKEAYGITQDDYDAMYDRQGGCCAICGDSKEPWEPGAGISGRLRFLVVDHDHGTARVRALLCWNCNSGLGQFREDPAIMRAAVAYLGSQGTHPPA